jgi:hypothetical protein
VASKFWKTCWEKQPAVFKGAGTPRQELLKGVMSFAAFCNILDEREEQGDCLLFDVDAHVMRYVDGERQDFAPTDDGIIERSLADDVFKDGATFQVGVPYISY